MLCQPIETRSAEVQHDRQDDDESTGCELSFSACTGPRPLFGRRPTGVSTSAAGSWQRCGRGFRVKRVRFVMATVAFFLLIAACSNEDGGAGKATPASSQYRLGWRDGIEAVEGRTEVIIEPFLPDSRVEVDDEAKRPVAGINKSGIANGCFALTEATRRTRPDDFDPRQYQSGCVDGVRDWARRHLDERSAEVSELSAASDRCFAVQHDGTWQLRGCQGEGEPYWKWPPTRPVYCMGVKATMVGSSGPDRMRGTALPDVIVGLDGADVIDGREGDDIICAGPNRAELVDGRVEGFDFVLGGGGADRIYGGSGLDILDGSGYVPYSHNGRDRLFGGPNPRLTGFGQDGEPVRFWEVLIGKGTGDLLVGGPGDDLLLNSWRSDQPRATDRADGGSGKDICRTADRSGPSNLTRRVVDCEIRDNVSITTFRPRLVIE